MRARGRSRGLANLKGNSDMGHIPGGHSLFPHFSGTCEGPPHPAPGYLCRQRAEPRAVTWRSEGSEGPVQTNQHLTPRSPQDWGQSEDGKNLCISSPVRPGGPEPPPSLSLPQDAIILSSPPLPALSSHRALRPAGGGARRPEVLQPHVVAKPRSPDSQSRADGPPWPLGSQR